MGDGIKLAIAIVVMFLAMVAFFFAFHPGGVTAANNPDDIMQWLIGEFQNTSTGTSTELENPSADQPGGQPESPNVPPQTKDVGPNSGI